MPLQEFRFAHVPWWDAAGLCSGVPALVTLHQIMTWVAPASAAQRVLAETQLDFRS